MDSILKLPNRTIKKILTRLSLGCSNCGWNECPGDIHHIIPKSKGGSDDHKNLTYLCPNCHRMAHNNKLFRFTNLVEQIGDSWKEVYFPKTKNINNIVSVRREKRQRYLDELAIKLRRLEESDIDFSKHGWCRKAAIILGVSHQNASRWVKKNAPHIYSKCKIRSR